MTDDLPRLIEPENLAQWNDRELLLVHVADGAAYERAHLAAARLVEPRQLVRGEPPAPGRLPDAARLEALFSGLDYAPERWIVAYDDEGGGWAGRFIWTLDVIGHRRWSYLNGGVHAASAAGLPLVSGPPPEPAAAPVTLHLRRGPTADLEDVLAAIGDDTQVIWDVRSAAEYRGDKSGSRRAGHVPGAVNLDWTALKDPERDTRLVGDLRDRLVARGITPDKRIITHCQTHHRSGLSYLVARLLEYPDVRAYPGSWAEWGNRDDTPVVTGPQPGGVEGGRSR